MGRHLFAAAAVDDHRFGAEAPGGARDVDGGVAAAVNHHAATELQRRLAGFHVAQETDRIDDARRVGARYFDAFSNVRADRDETGVETAAFEQRRDIVDAAVEPQFHAHVDDALHFAVDDLARQPVAGDAETHHAARQRPGLVDFDRVTQARQVIGRRQPARPRADHENALAAGRRGNFCRPLLA